MRKHDTTTLDLARDELFSHIQRCCVLSAHHEARTEWLEDTMGYIDQRYPTLSALERAQLETMASRYLQPAIPHGKDKTALNWSEWTEDATEAASQREMAGTAT